VVAAKLGAEHVVGRHAGEENVPGAMAADDIPGATVTNPLTGVTVAEHHSLGREEVVLALVSEFITHGELTHHERASFLPLRYPSDSCVEQ